MFLEENEGRGWHGDPQGHAEVGRQGGEKVAPEKGSEFYSEIGRQGGQSQGQENNPENFANNPEKASEAGREGGSR